jgi:shikimate kinase
MCLDLVKTGDTMPVRNVVLVGFMGTGKTTVGQLLAKQMHLPLVDMDALIEERAGKPITAIFEQDGEPHFRALEREITQELSTQEGQIISTGGGIVLNPDNISDYEQNGLVICLLASADEILNRVKHDHTRPLLAGNKEDNIRKLLDGRRPLYEAIPHKIDTDGLTPEQICEEIISLYPSNNP